MNRLVLKVVLIVSSVCTISRLTDALCTPLSDVDFMRLQLPTEPLNVAITDNGAAVNPSAQIDAFNNAQWKRFLMTVRLYVNCDDNLPRVTIRNTVTANRKYYFTDSSPPGSQLDFTMHSPAVQQNPYNAGILHRFTKGPQFDFMTFISEDNQNILQNDILNVVYDGQPGNDFEWNVFPNPKFDGLGQGEIWGDNPETTSRSRNQRLDNRVQFFNRGGSLDTVSIRSEEFGGIPRSGLIFDIYSYKMYTGFDRFGRFTYTKAVVFKDPNRNYFVSPTIEEDTGIAPLCETFRFSQFRRPLLYQSVTLKEFNDAARAARSPIAARNITEANIADQRWFLVEETRDGFARLRLSYDLDKYLALLRLGPGNFKLIITTFRYDLSNILSFEFDIQFPVTVPARRPLLPCMVNNRCQWPGEVKERTPVPNFILFPEVHPSCKNRGWIINDRLKWWVPKKSGHWGRHH